ncbi:MAG: TonB-dependent receptor [Niastella sp.]|nr:TonB-dependent receptor [Niastella sp.]
MTKLFAICFCCTLIVPAKAQQSTFNDTMLLQPVELSAVRASERMPFTKTNLTKKDIEKNNIGQDLPFLLNKVPGVVVNSDAGNGIGYTNMRIRGTDATRINITLNGIPFNDAESQGSFFVDMPDIASSASNIQVQRGVGTSSNGSGAFGASINIGTNEIEKNRKLSFNNTVGSYHSIKNTLNFNSGLLNKHFTVDARLSHIRSDGYIERAASRLYSLFGSMAYINNKNSVRFNFISGKEKTYQAWDGVPEYLLTTNRRFNSAGTEKPGSPYANETDNYLQNHYQLFYNHSFNNRWKANIATFLTRGKGYYEQYKADAAFAKYKLPEFIQGADTITHTDLVRQLWLDNYFYGVIFSGQYNSQHRQFILGGAMLQYDGKHYGKIIWNAAGATVSKDFRWYDVNANKNDFNFYSKWTERLSNHWQTFADLQYRHVDYKINGFRDHPALFINNQYNFFNPKIGLSFTQQKTNVYLSYSRAGKEPNRDDFEAGLQQQPKPEKLNDFELGMEQKFKSLQWGITLYYMLYKDQLIPTGQINDVGAVTRFNINDSYRAGVEISFSANPISWLSLDGNLAISKNKIQNFTAFVDDYDNGGQVATHYTNTDIAFSPALVANFGIVVTPIPLLDVSLQQKYVSRQYLDNTSNNLKSIHPYYIQDLRVDYTFKKLKISELHLFAGINNLLSKKYEANGYTYSYFENSILTTENYYFPMAPRNFILGLNIQL